MVQTLLIIVFTEYLVTYVTLQLCCLTLLTILTRVQFWVLFEFSISVICPPTNCFCSIRLNNVFTRGNVLTVKAAVWGDGAAPLISYGVIRARL